MSKSGNNFQKIKNLLPLFFLLIIFFNTCGQENEINEEVFFKKLIQAAIERTTKEIVYDPSYFRLDYPYGDIPENKGVCTDVLIRAYRKVGIDLQYEVHEDMKKNFSHYPEIWGLDEPDPNIDHRRVPNLMTFFKRMDCELPITDNPNDYKPGDIVAWDLGGGITHIGIVTNEKSEDKKRNKIVHNIGNGPKLEDILFTFKVIGHYRYKKGSFGK